MKDLNIEFVKQYLKVDFPDDDLLIDTIIKGAKSYIISYTGLKKVETDKINFALTTILDMHARNNL